MPEFAGDSIETFSGIHMFPFDPRPEMVRLEDIAHSLAYQCRFQGHVKKFYSVAEHCIHVSLKVPRQFAAVALMHDAAEAYLTDLPRPLKQFAYFCIDKQVGGLPYAHFESQLLKVIMEHFSIPWTRNELPQQVKEVDDRMLVTEYLALVNENPPERHWAVNPYVYNFGGLSPKDAKKEFLQRARKLGIKDPE
jgi:hypothetical protein